MKIVKIAAALTGLLIVSPLVQAQQAPYVFGNLGYNFSLGTLTHSSKESKSEEGTGSGIGEIGFGYRYSNFAAELSAYGNTKRNGYTNYGARLGLLAYLPIEGSAFEPYAKISAGYERIQFKNEAYDFSKEKKNHWFQPGFAVGVAYKIDEQLSVRAEYEHVRNAYNSALKTRDEKYSVIRVQNTNAFKIGLTYSF